MRSAWTFPLGQIFGVPVRLHLSFVFVLLWLGSMTLEQGGGFFQGAFFALVLLGSVAVHGLAHLVAAAPLGASAQELVLHPVGETLHLIPRAQGLRELRVALAGPLSSLALALLASAGALASGGSVTGLDAQSLLDESSALTQLMLANVFLFGLNLLPIVPLDGTRILRGLLRLATSEERAVITTSVVGHALALAIGVAAASAGHWMIFLIALLGFMACSQELTTERQLRAMRNVKVGDVMLTRFETIAPHQSLAEVEELIMRSWQRAFPVVDAWGRPAGVLTRRDYRLARGRLSPEAHVLDAMHRDVSTVGPRDAVLDIMATLVAEPERPALVVDENGVIGILTREALHPVEAMRGAS